MTIYIRFKDKGLVEKTAGMLPTKFENYNDVFQFVDTNSLESQVKYIINTASGSIFHEYHDFCKAY